MQDIGQLGVFAPTYWRSYSQKSGVKDGGGKALEEQLVERLLWRWLSLKDSRWQPVKFLYQSGQRMLLEDQQSLFLGRQICSHLHWLPIARHHCFLWRIARVSAIQSQVSRHKGNPQPVTAWQEFQKTIPFLFHAAEHPMGPDRS